MILRSAWTVVVAPLIIYLLSAYVDDRYSKNKNPLAVLRIVDYWSESGIKALREGEKPVPKNPAEDLRDILIKMAHNDGVRGEHFGRQSLSYGVAIK